MLFWRVPTTGTSHRLGGRVGPYRQGRPFRSASTFQVCRLNNHHMVSIAVGLGVITLLLVIFAYHGGYGVGSWFYSLLVVLSGLAFVVFGPLLLCRFVLHAYYRQLEARTMRLRATAQTQTGDAASITISPDGPPHVYACIIIAQDDGDPNNSGRGGGAIRLSDLPTYEEAVLGGGGTHPQSSGHVMVMEESGIPPETKNENIPSSSYSQPQIISGQQQASSSSTTTEAAADTKNESCCASSSSDDKSDEMPPPTYVEALEMITSKGGGHNTVVVVQQEPAAGSNTRIDHIDDIDSPISDQDRNKYNGAGW